MAKIVNKTMARLLIKHNLFFPYLLAKPDGMIEQTGLVTNAILEINWNDAFGRTNWWNLHNDWEKAVHKNKIKNKRRKRIKRRHVKYLN